MAKFWVHESHTRSFLADAEALKAEYPTEYADFLEHSGNTSDRAWVKDCADSGGVEILGHPQSDECYLEIEAVSRG